MWTLVHLLVLVPSLLPPAIRGDVVHFLPPPVLIEPPPQGFSGLAYLDTDNNHNHNHNNQWQSITDTPAPPPPIPVETTTRFSLPEIIINRSASGGYPSEVAHNHNGGEDSIVVHNQYLPPTPATTTTTTTTYRPPLFQDELNYYLPATSSPSTSSSTDRNPNTGRNLYYYPRPPIQFDEPFVEPIYTPPVTQPPQQYLPPTSPPSNAYLPPAATRSVQNRTDNDFFGFSNSIRSPLRLEMTEMKCLSSGEGGFFRTRITVQSFINTLPVFEESSGCTHRLEISRNQLLIQIPVNEFKLCGVNSCGQRNEELCAKIRFPQIRGMRTVNDAILALQCKPQEKTVVKTHALKMGISSER